MTLAECLVVPLRAGSAKVEQDFLDVLLAGNNTVFASIDGGVARQAADIRARYNLSLVDAMQVSVALTAGCEAVLINDVMLQRVSELRIVVLDELEVISKMVF